jgi:hypothetical protein
MNIRIECFLSHQGYYLGFCVKCFSGNGMIILNFTDYTLNITGDN